MRCTILAFATIALTGALPSAAQVKDTTVAEVLCRGEGFTPHTPVYGRCVIEKMAKLSAASSPAQAADEPKNAKVSDPYVSLGSDFERANLADSSGSYDIAFNYMLKAARSGDSRAFAPMGRYYMDGTGAPADAAKGLFWLRKAETARDPASYPLLAQAYLNGRGVPLDPQKAFSYVEIARGAGASSQSQEIEQMLAQRVGGDAITCARYGMALGTMENGQCRLQLEQVRQQAAFQQRQHELQVAQYQQQLAAYEAQQKALKREKNRREGEFLMRLGQGLLGGQSFSESSLSAYGLNSPRPTPPPAPAPTQNYTLRLPNGNQVYCSYSSLSGYVSCR